MGLLTGVIRDEAGNIMAGAKVYVYAAGTSTLSSLFSDSALAVATTNPVTVDSRGSLHVYVADGSYKLVLSRSGLAPQTIDYVPAIDPLNYAFLMGRSGGQNLYLGTGSGEGGAIRATSHATKGTVSIANVLYALEATARAGVNTASPLTALHVNSGSAAPAGEVGGLLVAGASSSERLGFGYQTGTGGWIQSTLNGTGSTNLRLNPNGGTITLGTNALFCAVHNVAAGAGATQAIASGTYTPTLTGITNIAATTSYAAQWLRVGSVVTVSGHCDVDTTTGSAASVYEISLPIASALAVDNQLAGALSFADAASYGSIYAGTANDRARCAFTSDAGAINRRQIFHFTYVLV